MLEILKDCKIFKLLDITPVLPYNGSQSRIVFSKIPQRYTYNKIFYL
jgi:hypothetical protein